MRNQSDLPFRLTEGEAADYDLITTLPYRSRFSDVRLGRRSRLRETVKRLCHFWGYKYEQGEAIPRVIASYQTDSLKPLIYAATMRLRYLYGTFAAPRCFAYYSIRIFSVTIAEVIHDDHFSYV